MPKDTYFVRCPRCGENFDEKLKYCPHCDTPNRKMICRSCGTQINATPASVRNAAQETKR
jgi:ribosomal protein L37E